MKSREQFCLVKDTILLNDFDIFTISETWLDSTVDNASIEISGYQLIRQDRGPYKSGGGLCIYNKSSLKAIVLEDLSLVSDDGLQQLWLSVQCRKQKSFLICNVYRPPGTPINCFDTLADHLISSLSLGFDIIILGDLNCNVLRSCPEATALLDFISSFNLSQLVDKPTRITETSQSIIDVIMTTNKSMIGLCDVLTCSISDHNLIYIVLTLKSPRNKASYITTQSYTNYNADKFREDLSLVPFHTFNTLFLDVLNRHAPIKRIKIKSRPNPFVTSEIRQLMRTRDRWHKSAIKTNDKLHWNVYRFFRQEVKHELRFAEKAYVRNEIFNSHGNTNAIWKIINRCLPKKTKHHLSMVARWQPIVSS